MSPELERLTNPTTAALRARLAQQAHSCQWSFDEVLDQLAEAEAARDAALRERDEARGDWSDKAFQHANYVTQLEAERDAAVLQASQMRKYAHHLRGCKIRPDSPVMRALTPKGETFVPVPCSCGFDAALSTPSAALGPADAAAGRKESA